MGSAAFESADQESFGGGEKGLFSCLRLLKNISISHRDL